MLLITLSILFLCILALIVFLFARSKLTEKKLKQLVEERTCELKLQTTTLTTLFDSFPDLLFIKDMDLRFIECNKAFLEFFGRNKEEIIGKDDIEGLGLSFEKAEEFREWDKKVLTEGRTVVIEEYSPRADGTIPLVETIKTPLILDGDAVGVLGIARDISKHKEMEHKIVFSYEYAKKLSDTLAKITKLPAISMGNFETAADIISQEGCIALNTFCIGIWRLEENEENLECISCYDAYTGDNPIKDKFNLSIRQEYANLLKSERLIVMKNSNDCKLVSVVSDDYYNSLCAALHAPIHVNGKMIGVVCVEQMRCKEYPEMREWSLEEQNFVSSLADLMAVAISGSDRRKALDAAEMASQTKSSFLANMSHEIRTPMNAILGVTEILIQHESLPAEIEEGLGKIYSSCDLLLGIINDILDISKIEAGKLDIMPAKYNVASMINDSVQLNMMRIDSKPIEFELQVDENVPAKLIGDELRIKQILNNLLSNAFKYTDAGKVTLSVFSISNKEDVTLVLSVRDTGYGMTKEQLGKMFETYSRFNQRKNNTIEGAGLGLAITQRLLNLMNGDLYVESELGVGSFFVVKLPQQTINSEVLGKDVAANLQQFQTNYMTQRKRGQISRDPMPYGSVLIVDDVETNLYVALGLMKLYKLKIDTAMSGYEAINKIKQNKTYDVIFMDHMMPEMDGIEATKNIRDLGYEEPIVALTANAVAGQADMFMQNGFDDFISKPIDIRQLDTLLNKYVRDKQPPEVIEAARSQKTETKNSNTQQQTDKLLHESFIRDAQKTITWLEENYLQTDDEEILRKYIVIVHGIKSSLANIEETSLSNMALKLEKLSRENDIDQIKTLTPDFLNDLRTILNKLKSRQNELCADEDIDDLIERLTAIQETTAEYDRKSALEIISEIKNYSKETKKVLDIITEHVLHSEFEMAENAAAVHTVSLTLTQKQTSTQLLNKDIPGLNIIKGFLRYGCDEQTYLRVLRSYSASVRSMLDVIENVSEKTLNDYKIKVHGIKGTSYDIFAGQVAASAKSLEEAAKSGDLAYINEHNPIFLEIIRKIVYDIDKLLSDMEAENPKPKKDKPDSNELLKLLIACKDYDMDGADQAMSEIEKYNYESDDGLADWLRDSIDKMDFKQIVEKLGGLV